MQLSQRPQNFSTLFLDMNSFFASIEQQVQPPLRGKPIGIAPYTGSTGCIIAKSQPAKEWGVKTGDLVKEARQKCPSILILESRPALYQFYHREIFKLLQSFSPFVTVASIDEFYISLTGRDCSRSGATNLAWQIKRAIKEKIGDYLTCSVGIGPNRFLAKTAGESQKPDGLVVVRLEDLASFYSQLKLLDLPGINIQMAAGLARHKIKTSLDFYQTPLLNLRLWFGHLGKVWYWRLRGYEVDDLKIPTKSIGHSFVLPPELRTFQSCRKVLIKLTKKAGTRLRQANLAATKVWLGIFFLEGEFWNKSKKVGIFSDNQTFLCHILNLFDTCPIKKTPLTLALSAGDLVVNYAPQINLFSQIEKSKKISQAMDKICDRFGPDAIMPAAMIDTENLVPDRIPFGRPRYDITNF